jgi:glucosylceramidase
MVTVSGTYKTVAVYETAKPAGTGTHGPTDKLVSKTANIVASSTRPTVVAVTSTQRQTVLGFGVSLTEAATIAMSKLAPADRSNIIDTYFNPTKAHMTFARLPIASCDFSWLPYSYATKADLSDFSIQHDIDSGLIQLIKDAQTSAGGAGHIAFVASPWSAPPFMKDSNSYYTGSLLPADYGTFAQYIAKYVTAMAGQGIPIWAVTPENEPEHTGGFETMGFNPTTEGAFISGGLGAAMEGLTPPVKILGFDHNKGSSLTNWAGGLYGNANVKKYLAGIGAHWYGSVVNPFTDSLDTANSDMGPGQVLIGTEQGLSAIHPPIPTNLWMNDAWYWGPNSPDWHCSFPATGPTCPANNPLRVGVYRVAEDIIASFNHWEAGWIQWNAVTDKWGGPSHEDYGTLTHPGTRAASPYMIDACGVDGSCGQGATPVLSGTQAIYDTPTLYILQHFSRFMLPGGKVLQSSLAGAGVALTIPAAGGDPTYNLPDMQALAVANPDQTVAVAILNEKTTPVDYAITIGNQAVEGTISASAIQTVVLSP